MRILFLSRWYPFPADNGSKLRVSGLLRALSERHEVTLVSFYNPAEVIESAPGSLVEVRTCPFRDFEPTSARAILGLLSARPRFLVDTHQSEMHGLIQDALAHKRYDVLVASQLSMAAYYTAFRGVTAIFEEVELGAYRGEETQRRLAPWILARRRLTWEKHRRFMARLLGHFSLCTVASETERQLLAEAVPNYHAVYVVPNSVDTQNSINDVSKRTPNSLIFTGSLRYWPNRDAMSWFAEQILPMVRAEVGSVRVIITGDPGRDLLPRSDEVTLTGRVADVRPLLASSAVSIAPIRAGGGTRLKILEAMAARTPIVATSKALEGLDVKHQEHALVADTPMTFAAAVVSLLKDPSAATAMADRAYRLCLQRYDSTTVASQFLEIVDRLVAA